MTNNSTTPDRLRDIVKAESFLWGASTADIYHGPAASGMDTQWKWTIAPILARYTINFDRCIDFAAGYGRNTRKLLEAGARHVTMVDVNPECATHLKSRFPEDRANVVLNNGVDLSDLDTAAFTFLYSFDAIVHFDLEIILSYIPEFSRVLEPGAYTFLHHSNYTGNPGGDFRQNPHLRNFMSADIFKHVAVRSGFALCQQDIITWGKHPELDCITVLRRNG